MKRITSNNKVFVLRLILLRSFGLPLIYKDNGEDEGEEGFTNFFLYFFVLLQRTIHTQCVSSYFLFI